MDKYTGFVICNQKVPSSILGAGTRCFGMPAAEVKCDSR